jgi:hypothetical protein
MYGKVHILREEECFKENKIFILKIIMFNVIQYKSKVFSTLLRHGGGLTGPQNRLYLR